MLRLTIFLAAAISFATIVFDSPHAHAAEPAAAKTTQTQNVIWVMLDGLRWQEVFFGADEGLLNKDRGGVANVPLAKKEFSRATVAERREAMMPFLWGEIATKGQIYGNQSLGSVARVTNAELFSYPGYNEVLCGFADARIDSNDKIPNRNVTVLEWLHAKPEFAGKVAAFTSWDVFPFIINSERSGIPVSSGTAAIVGLDDSPEVRLMNRIAQDANLFDDTTRPDVLTFLAAKMCLQTKKPRVLFVSFDETDAQGHAGRYDRVVGGARKGDSFIGELWETAQAMPEYQGKTTLIVTTDHGRGDPPVEWKNHNKKTPGSENIWIAILGPDTPALGERKEIAPVTQSQVAATAAALLGYDYHAAEPKAGKAMGEAVGTK